MNPMIKGSLSAMRDGAGQVAKGKLHPIFHQYMVTLAGIILYDSEDVDRLLGLGQYTSTWHVCFNSTPTIDEDERHRLATEMHIYITSPIFQYMPICQEDENALLAIGKDYRPAEDLTWVLRYCALQQAFIARQILINNGEDDGASGYVPLYSSRC